MDYLVLEGRPYQIGKRKAEFDGDYLKEILDYYDQERNVEFERWIAGKAIPYIESRWPDLAEEVEGYLDASGFDKLAMYKRLYSQAKRYFTCSNVAIETTDAGFVFAKNTDLIHWELPHTFFFHYKPDRGQEFFGYSYKGSYMVQGMNRSGLCNGGASMSGIVEPADAVPNTGSPMEFIQRQVMQYAESAEQAVDIYREHAMFDKARGLMVLDAGGECKSINISRTFCHVRDETALPAYCTGFFDTDKYEWREDFKSAVETKKAREAFAEAYFRQKVTHSFQDLLNFLKSHGPDWSKPGQWCRHYPQEPSFRTCASHVCIPAQRKVLYCHGNPCETPYKEFVFDS